ncbi:carboxynorspermidine decarboxylase [Clostridia bacterium]|nr:carboxynorspermidine decarboxylase [Clostridia bacterium]
MTEARKISQIRLSKTLKKCSFSSPAYVMDEALLKGNLAILEYIQRESGAKILLAQKAFSSYDFYPLLAESLYGTTASSLYEARLGREYFSCYSTKNRTRAWETHIFSPAYQEKEMSRILLYCDHIVFNSFAQWRKFYPMIVQKSRRVECGLRINPQHSEGKVEMYDPSAAYSRLGIPFEEFEKQEDIEQIMSQVKGLHFHTLCEQDFPPLRRTLNVVEKKFGKYLHQMDWLNLGGGHHLTRPDYQVEELIACLKEIAERYQVQVYLEPGEAVVWQTGYLVGTVIDIVENGMSIAILDVSAACHMPDVLEMPYRPEIVGAGNPEEKAYLYRLGGPTCLAGDIIGDYSFDEPLEIGSRLIFCDMMHYTTVKTNTFNGIALPSFYVYSEYDELHLIKEFAYEDFRNRLGSEE